MGGIDRERQGPVAPITIDRSGTRAFADRREPRFRGR